MFVLCETGTMNRQEAKRWCFTINNPTDDDKWWEKPEISGQLEYLVVQEERGEEGTVHYQGFVIFKSKKRLSWIKNNCNNRGHFEVTKGSNKEASDYCKKDETYTGGLRVEIGQMPERKAGKASERLEKAADELDQIKTVYKRPREIDSMTLLQSGFTQAYKLCTDDILGPFRPNLRILTLIGPPGCGKSWTINSFFPHHGLCIYGNSGCWFQNPSADCMIFEEFNGQIQLQKMLQYLDPYPLALEVKGRMAPACYDTVIITSNVTPKWWYPINDSSKREAAVHALWDRLGFCDNGNYRPHRGTGIYLEAPPKEDFATLDEDEYILSLRTWFRANIAVALNIELEDMDDRDGDGDGSG